MLVFSLQQNAGKSSSPPSTTTFNSDMYIADGDYIKDIEVNDLRNRYTLTKGATQKMVKIAPLSGCPLTLMTIPPTPPTFLTFLSVF